MTISFAADPRRFAHIILLCIATAMATSANAADKTQPADVIFTSGDIYTGANAGRAQALAVSKDRVVAVGSNQEIQKLKGRYTAVVDLGGRFVMPGFNDAHAHLAAGGLDYLHVDLLGSMSLVEMKQRIATAAEKTAAGEWLVGRGWDQTLWAEPRLPSRQDVDDVTGGHPAIFQRVDGHIALLNSAGLKAAGITRATPDPKGGSIDRDAAGQPTGIVRESVRDAVIAKLPKPSIAQRRRGIELALAEAARWGVTSVQDSISVEDDVSEWQNFLVYEDLEREGILTARISFWLPFNAPMDLLQTHRAHHQQKDAMLHTGLLKAYLDGALGSRTAALFQPYSDDPRNSGILREDESRLKQLAVERVRAGFQLAFHAIGDRAAQEALDTFAESERDARERGQAPPRGFRFRIEHDQVITPEQVGRFASLGVVASVQPCHLLTDMNWAEARLGSDRARNSYPWSDFLKNGVTLAFGTDFPVEPINPFRNLYAAVTRKNEAGTKEYFPAQKMTMDQAIAASTRGSAYAQFEEMEKGALEPGKLADFVVLDRDITKAAPVDVLHARVLRTVVGGRTVFDAK
jgi:predicted amidohydrolase YtcJ